VRNTLIGRPSRARSESSVDAPHAALLIDFDNVTLGIRSDLQNQLRKLLNSDMIKGKVSVQRAYADWRRYPQYIVSLSEASIDLIFAPAFGASKKNATDIRLAIDALELVFTRPEIGTFILLSGDSDFSALVLKLKEYGKYVIGVGIRESSSDLLIQNCDEYFSYNELTGLAKEGEIEHVRRDPWQLVVEAVQKMLNDGDVMRSDRLKQVMQGIDPKFDEKDAGFNRFSKFVVAAAGRGLVSPTKMENGQYAIALGSNANVLPEGEAAAKTAGTDVQAGSTETRRRRGRKRSETTTVPQSLVLAESFELLKQALVAIGAVGEKSTDREQAREKMIELHGIDSDPVFESRRFLRMLRQAHDADLIELIKSDGDQYQLKLGRAAAVELGDHAAPEADDKAAGDQGAEPGGTKKTTRRKRATTKRSTGVKTSTAAEPEVKPVAAGTDAVTAVAASGEQVIAGGEEAEKVSKAKKATRRKRVTSRRPPRTPTTGDESPDQTSSTKADAAAESKVEAGGGGESEDGGEPKEKATRRKTAGSRRSPRHSKTDEETKQVTGRNPGYRRGSRGTVPKPTVPPEEPKSSESDEQPIAAEPTPRSTSGARSLGGRRGSRGARTVPPRSSDSESADRPEPKKVAEPSIKEGPSPLIKESPVAPLTPKEPQQGGLFDEGSTAEEPEKGLFGRIRAALHKAVGPDSQSSDNEGG
jgi:uncharacterized protein (TIGR00288 family)